MVAYEAFMPLTLYSPHFLMFTDSKMTNGQLAGHCFRMIKVILKVSTGKVFFSLYNRRKYDLVARGEIQLCMVVETGFQPTFVEEGHDFSVHSPLRHHLGGEVLEDSHKFPQML